MSNKLPRLTLEEIRSADANELFILMEQYANVADDYYGLWEKTIVREK